MVECFVFLRPLGLRLKKCRNRFEKKQGFSDKPEAICPQCSGKSKRLMSLGAVIYKGSGFYITDQRKEKDIADIGKPSRETAEKYPQFSGLDKDKKATDNKAADKKAA